MFSCFINIGAKQPMVNTSVDIKEAISQIYLADVEAIRNLSEVASKLQKDGGLTIPGNLTIRGSFNYLPKGTIVAFNSDKAPEGWALCNGANGTPDLRGRFLIGYNETKEDYNKIGKTGGTEFHKLTLDEIPGHNHGEAGEHTHKYVDRGNGAASTEGNKRNRADNT